MMGVGLPVFEWSYRTLGANAKGHFDDSNFYWLLGYNAGFWGFDWFSRVSGSIGMARKSQNNLPIFQGFIREWIN